jgi:hypothetical protein
MHQNKKTNSVATNFGTILKTLQLLSYKSTSGVALIFVSTRIFHQIV